MTDHLTLHLGVTPKRGTRDWARLGFGMRESDRKHQAMFKVQGQRSKLVEPNLFPGSRGELKARTKGTQVIRWFQSKY